LTRVMLGTVRLLEFLEGGGHLWVYMQYVDALRRLGCEVYLLDSFTWSSDTPSPARIRDFRDRLARYGVADAVIVGAEGEEGAERHFGIPESEAWELLESVDLLLNFNYHLSPELVSAPRSSALVDIDPGLLQFWMSRGFIQPASHSLYFTTGETVGAPDSPIPDCGLRWHHIRPPVSLQLWPEVLDGPGDAFTTVSSWWGERDYVGEPGNYYDNTKRTAFLDFLDLPRHTDQQLEVSLFLAESDALDRRRLENHGWRVRHSTETAGSPDAYQAYVQASRGEFGWAKASCMRFQNAWVSDRTVCYLASGRPAVVQHTGPSSYLPDAEGIFRFRTLEDAARSLDAVNADYKAQSHLARRLAEEYFDAQKIVGGMLEVAL